MTRTFLSSRQGVVGRAMLFAAMASFVVTPDVRAQTQPGPGIETPVKVFATEVVQRLHDALRLGKPEQALIEFVRPGGEAEVKLREHLKQLAELISGGKVD